MTPDAGPAAVTPPPPVPLPGNGPSRRRLVAGAGLAAVGGLGGALGLALLGRGAHAGLVGERQHAAHLLRRAGFGPSPADVDAALKAGLPATVETLLHPERVDDSGLEARLRSDAFDTANIEQLRRWWVVRMAVTRRPLLEKMTLFWHGLLTSSYRKAGRNFELMHTQNEFLRQHALGNLRDLLVGISKDGAMLRWLDGTGSTKAHPNENYARELMELFTMGVGNYAETDVRELARAMTGWYVDHAGSVGFRPRAHDDGPKTFLGHTGNLGLEDAIDIILAQPATPRHLATRMWEYFVYPGPSDADLKPVIDAYHASRYDVRAMMAAVLGSSQLFSDRAYRALVKSPVELVAGVARQLGLSLDVNAFVAMEAMGQALFDPPNVAGWPGGPGWLSTGAWMARARWLLSLSQHNAATHAVAGGGAQAEDKVGHAVEVMLEGNVSPGARAAVTERVRGLSGGAAAAELFFLVAATPEYQLA